MWRRRIQIDQRRQSSRNALSRHAIRLPRYLLQLLYCQFSHSTSLTLTEAVLDSGAVTPGVSRKDAKFAKGDLARGGCPRITQMSRMGKSDDLWEMARGGFSRRRRDTEMKAWKCAIEM